MGLKIYDFEHFKTKDLEKLRYKIFEDLEDLQHLKDLKDLQFVPKKWLPLHCTVKGQAVEYLKDLNCLKYFEDPKNTKIRKMLGFIRSERFQFWDSMFISELVSRATT